MSGDVRSLEEVFAAEARNQQLSLSVNVAGFAAAVREWCLAPEQIERAAREIWEDGYQSCDWQEITDENRRRHYLATARRALQAVMGDTP